MVSLIAGWILILAITSVIPTNPAIYASTSLHNTAAPVAIWADARSSRLGAEFLLLIAVMAQAFCGMASVTANSRMLFAFSRDGAVPGHKYWHRINPRTRTPTNSHLVLRRLRLHSRRPLDVERRGLRRRHLDRHHRSLHRLRRSRPCCAVCRARAGRAAAGASGKWSPLVGWVGNHLGRLHRGALHAARSGLRPINRDTFNYAPIAVGVVLLFSGGYWLLSARKWFTGPKVQGDEAELKRIEGEFANIERELEEVD